MGVVMGSGLVHGVVGRSVNDGAMRVLERE